MNGLGQNKSESKMRRTLITIALTALLTSCDSGPAIEYVHLPGTEPAAGVNMPFTSAIKVNSGTLVFLSGITSASVPHSHPHVAAEFDHLDFSAEAQTEEIMQRMTTTLKAAGGDAVAFIESRDIRPDFRDDPDPLVARRRR